MEPAQPKLLDRLHNRIRVKHYSIRTEEQYVHWVKRFIHFHGKRHPETMGAREVEAFLNHLTVEGRVSASTQNQAKSALLFLYKEVLGKELPWLENVASAKRPARVPVVLTRKEVDAVLSRLEGVAALAAWLMYGTGMRVMECLRLRVKDVDFARWEIVIRSGKGSKDRVTVLPTTLVAPLTEHLARVQRLHEEDLKAGHGEVYPSPCGRAAAAARDQKGCPRRRNRQAGNPPHLAPFVRDAPIGVRVRYPHGAGAARA